MEFERESVMLTGVAGFIGSHTAHALFERGAKVVGIDNFDPFYDRSVKESNLESVRSAAEQSGAAFEFHEMDLVDQAALTKIMRESQTTGVIHLAAKAGVRPSIEDPQGYTIANVVATQSVLSASSATGCARCVVASSSSVYGNNEKVPFAETDSVESPISPYAATKRACELIGSTHHALTGLPVAMLRFFTVFGPGQRPDLAIHLFLRMIAAGEKIKMFGDGSTSRDYTMINDIVDGVIASYERIDQHGYRIWNLGGDDPTRLDTLISTIGEVVGVAPIIEAGPMQPGDVLRTMSDLTRSRAELGYDPKFSLREGIELQYNWMRQQGLIG